MIKMRAIEAAVLVMRREGVDTAFGIPGAAINPLYSALQKVGGIDHVLACLLYTSDAADEVARV